MTEKINIDELSIHKAFRLAQMEFPLVRKTAKGGHGYYATLADCMLAVVPKLNKYGLSLRTESHEAEDGHVVIEMIITNDKGEKITSGPESIPYSGREGQIAQAKGSAKTYAKRYAVMDLCCLCPVDDDGEAASYLENAPKELVDAAKEAAEGGSAELEKFWTQRTKKELMQLKPYVKEIKAIRVTADEKLAKEQNNG